MRVLKILIPLLVVALILVVVYDLAVAPATAKRDAQNGASDTAFAAAHVLFTERDSQKPADVKSADAKKAADTRAEADNVTIVAFTIQWTPNVLVKVTVHKQAHTIVAQKISALHKYTGDTESATAAPS